MSDCSRRRLLTGSLAAGGAMLLPRGALAGVAPAGSFALKGPDGRAISITDWRPLGREKGLIVFSHGAASAPHFYEALFGPWLAAGWRILAPLHVDSTEHPDTAKFPGLASWKARIEDMRALHAYLGDRPRVAAGHSYGGLVALTQGGAAAVPPQGVSGRLDDPHVTAVLAFSPPAPVPVLVTAAGYGALAVPALIQTGTHDVPQLPAGMPPLPPDSWQGHLTPFTVAQSGHDRYGLVLEGADHYFGGAICRYDLPGPRQTAQLAAAVRLSRLFLDGFGAHDKAARRQLDAAVTEALPVRLLHK